MLIVNILCLYKIAWEGGERPIEVYLYMLTSVMLCHRGLPSDLRLGFNFAINECFLEAV